MVSTLHSADPPEGLSPPCMAIKCPIAHKAWKFFPGGWGHREDSDPKGTNRFNFHVFFLNFLSLGYHTGCPPQGKTLIQLFIHSVIHPFCIYPAPTLCLITCGAQGAQPSLPSASAGLGRGEQGIWGRGGETPHYGDMDQAVLSQPLRSAGQAEVCRTARGREVRSLGGGSDGRGGVSMLTLKFPVRE